MPEFKKAGEYKNQGQTNSNTFKDEIDEGLQDVDIEENEDKDLHLDPPAIEIQDEEAERWYRQIENFENVKNGAKLAKEKIKQKYPEEKYLELSKNGRIEIRISGLFKLEWEKTYTKANLNPKPTEEKKGVQLVIKPLKKK